MKAHARCGFLTILAFALSTGAVGAEDGSKIYLNGMKSCVMVRNLDRGTQGSGSLVNLQGGYILTNWHVVRQGSKMLVVFPIWEKERPVVERTNYENQLRKIGLIGEVVAADEKIDLAVIKLAEPTKIPKGAEAVKFASESPFAGAKIISIGNPGASDAMWIYTPGEVRAVYKKQWNSSSNGKKLGEHEARIIEATSPTSPGDSGGPCFNDKSEQTGVTQGGLKSDVAQGFSYFIDSSEVKAFLKSKKIGFSAANEGVMIAKEKADPAPEAKVEPVKKDLPKVDTAAAERAKQEKAATSMLNLLRPLAKDPSRQSFAVDKLRNLIKMYPKTEAAKEAQDLLSKIQ